MYDRAQRVLHDHGRSTVEHVGPGTYDLPGRKKAQGNAPFSSFAKRETFLDIPERVVVAPGPGQYEHETPLKEKTGSVSLAGHAAMASQTKRFQSASTVPPGPGTYTVTTDNKGKSLASRTFPPGAGSVTEDIGDATQRAPLHPENRLKYVRKTTVPSIPSCGKAYGYHETESGELCPQPAPSRDRSLGPAYYKIKQDETEATSKYKGNHFAARTAPRFQEKKPDHVPPPGYYNVDKPPTARPLSAPVPTEEDSRSRYHQIVEKSEVKKAFPGPGAYNIGTELGKNTFAETDAAFGSQTKRFSGHRSQAPPVGAYNDPRTSLQEVQKVTGVKKSAFGHSAARFKQEQQKRLPPPSTAYNLDHGNSIVDTCIRKGHVGIMGQFGSLAPRRTNLNDTKKTHLPGPAHYHPDVTGDGATDGGSQYQPPPTRYAQRNAKKRTAQFASGTQRLDELQRKGKEAPPPGSYEVAPSYDYMHGRQSKAKPTTYGANARQNSFLSGQQRFSKVGDVMGGQNAAYPDPAKYRTEEYRATGTNQKGSLMAVQTERFSEEANDVPGPGSYQLPPSMAHTVLKGTHNASLNNPLIDSSATNKKAGKAKFIVGPAWERRSPPIARTLDPDLDVPTMLIKECRQCSAKSKMKPKPSMNVLI